MDTQTHSTVKDKLVPEGSFCVSEDMALVLFSGDCGCPVFVRSQEISCCVYAFCKSGPGSRLSRPFSGAGKVVW